jgi:hypothetical protein
LERLLHRSRQLAPDVYVRSVSDTSTAALSLYARLDGAHNTGRIAGISARWLRKVVEEILKRLVKVRTFSDFLAAQLTPETAEAKTSNSTAATSKIQRRSSWSLRQGIA